MALHKGKKEMVFDSNNHKSVDSRTTGHTRKFSCIESILICLIVMIPVEAANYVYTKQSPYLVWPVNVNTTFHPNLTGIEGASRFTTNAFGYRGALPDGQENIAVLGGSAVEELYLDDSETTWSILSNMTGKVWRNYGRSGLTSKNHLEEVQHIRADKIYVMLGANDMLFALQNQEPPPTFFSSPDYTYKSTIIFKATRTIYSLLKGQKQDSSGDRIKQKMLERKNATKIDAKLNGDRTFDIDLARFQYNIRMMIKINPKIIFITQPTAWSNGENNLFWMGKTRYDNYYFSINTLVWSMEKYNHELLEVCDYFNLTCIDLASQMKDQKYFYDDMHFNELGARRAAEIILEETR